MKQSERQMKIFATILNGEILYDILNRNWETTKLLILNIINGILTKTGRMEI